MKKQSLSHFDLSNLLRITALHSLTSHWIIPKTDDFQQWHPNIMVQFAPSNCISNFHDSNLDVAIRLGKDVIQGLSLKNNR